MTIKYGIKLKELREKENISQEQLAQVLGIKRSSYNQFEQQYDIIPINRLNQIANYFNVSIDYLLNNTTTLKYKNSLKDIDFKKAGVRLKEWRKSEKITQTKLANILNTSCSTISGYEIGRYLIATPFLYDICKKYNISADYLLGKVDEPKYLK